MSEAALVLIVVSVVAASDIAIGLYFLRRADAVEVGAAPVPGASRPEALRKIGRLLVIAAPLMWFVVAALCFGLIPLDGFAPISLSQASDIAGGAA